MVRKIFCALLAALSALVSFFAVAEATVDNSARVLPSYEKEDLTPTLQKEVWEEEDLEFLYRQTGVGKSALLALQENRSALYAFQNALFYRGEVKHDTVSFSTPHDYLEDFIAPLIPLENGDIILTSTCHTFGWRNGHAGIVVNEFAHTTLESIAPGENSCLTTTEFFETASNFMILRLKDATKEERNKIALEAVETLLDLPYSLFVGIFSKKDQGQTPSKTNCSHLVWQAYKNAGYDIDSDKGLICTSHDIANSDLLEVVQVFGFDPITLW